jgi:hypothetical protein
VYVYVYVYVYVCVCVCVCVCLCACETAEFTQGAAATRNEVKTTHVLHTTRDRIINNALSEGTTHVLCRLGLSRPGWTSWGATHAHEESLGQGDVAPVGQRSDAKPLNASDELAAIPDRPDRSTAVRGNKRREYTHRTRMVLRFGRRKSSEVCGRGSDCDCERTYEAKRTRGMVEQADGE